MGEYGGAGYPLSYLFLETATSLEIGKRTKALQAWAEALKKAYALDPRFVHVDKDMAEIRMIQQTWNAKIQLCWWHLQRAVKQRLVKSNLSTTPYDSRRARQDFNFIDIGFVPLGFADSNEYEGGAVPDEHPPEQGSTATSINSLRIVIPRTTMIDGSKTSSEEMIAGENAPRLVIKVPPLISKTGTTSECEDISDSQMPEAPKRVFCGEEFREAILTMMDRHFCAHPLIPGYSHPSPEGIREWAVKDMYQFCVKYDLREVWAYLWENWYRRGRWELWARSSHPEIPRLKTTMMLESQ